MILNKALFSAILSVFTVTLCAQKFTKTSFFVSENGVEKKLAWAGGFNAPQFSQMDLNGDKKKELIVFDRSSGQISAFQHQQDFTYSIFPIPTNSFPSAISDWLLLRDFDLDGKEDLFTSGQFGDIKVYRNTSSGSTISFELVTNSLQSKFKLSGDEFTTNIAVNNTDIPAIDDLDGDGDLDILTFTLSGSTVEFHKNFSVEESGNAGLLFELKNRCYGYFEEAFDNNSLKLGVKNCLSNVDNPYKSLKHSGSTILSLDLNGDGVKELLLGDITFNNLAMLTMGKSSSGGDSAISTLSNFPANNPVDLTLFPSSFYLDLNFDGKPELLVAPNNKNSINNFNAVWLYTNTGSAQAPSFNRLTTNFLQGESIDWGENAFPQFIDLNQDGLLDLLIGGRGRSAGNSEFIPQLIAYTNIGTKETPRFALSNTDFGNLAGSGVGNGVIPCFGDLTGDGQLEMLIGDFTGKLHVFTKTGNNYQLSQANLSDKDGKAIDVGDFAHPILVDIDNNGTLDLVIGERGGNLNLYTNIGSKNNFIFEKTSDNWGNANANEFVGDNGFSTPFIYQEGNNKVLLLGSRAGNVRQYSITTDGSDFPLIDSAFGKFNNGFRSTVNLADINNDGVNDALIGAITGGAFIFTGEKQSGISTSEFNTLIYPNPAKDHLMVKPFCGNCMYTIYNLAGKVIPCSSNNGQIAIEHLENGFYFLSIKNNEQTRVLKFIKE